MLKGWFPGIIFCVFLFTLPHKTQAYSNLRQIKVCFQVFHKNKSFNPVYNTLLSCWPIVPLFPATPAYAQDVTHSPQCFMFYIMQKEKISLLL